MGASVLRWDGAVIGCDAAVCSKHAPHPCPQTCVCELPVRVGICVCRMFAVAVHSYLMCALLPCCTPTAAAARCVWEWVGACWCVCCQCACRRALVCACEECIVAACSNQRLKSSQVRGAGCWSNVGGEGGDMLHCSSQHMGPCCVKWTNAPQ